MTLPSAGRPARCAGSSHVPTKSEEYSHAFKSSLGTTSGPPTGGNTITINGTGLSTATSVDFGGVTATPTVTSDSSLSVTVPAGAAAGPVSVSVTTAGGTSNGLSCTYPRHLTHPSASVAGRR